MKKYQGVGFKMFSVFVAAFICVYPAAPAYSVVLDQPAAKNAAAHDTL